MKKFLNKKISLINLNLKKFPFINEIFSELEDIKKQALIEKDECSANLCWCYQTINIIQVKYYEIFKSLFDKKYQYAWNLMEEINLKIFFLRNNFNDLGEYNINYIQNKLFDLEKLFPYKLFTSRETIIKEEKCNICGQIISLRKHCKHEPGKLYNGQLCLRIVTKMELLAIALVQNPSDKYAILFPEGYEYDYSAIDALIKNIKSPFDYWEIKIKMVKKEEFIKIGRNDNCPCGSGRKYKQCCLGTEKELMEHIVLILNSKEKFETPIKVISTIKKL